jgi:hypothetical protein
MREEVYVKTGMTKMQVCEWHERFHDWHKTAGFFFHSFIHLLIL